MSTAYANAPGTASEAVRQSEVSGELERLTVQCEHVDKLVEILEVRLNPVLAQRGESATSDQKNPEPVRVPLAQNLHDRVRHLTVVSDRLDSIINRIEV